MRFNEKELVFLSRQPSERAAELGMRGPKKGDGKRRTFHHLVICAVSIKALRQNARKPDLPLKSTTELENCVFCDQNRL